MLLYVLFISAFLVRLINLNQSLWLDESVVAKVVQTIPFHQIPFSFSPADVHPPLYYLFMTTWSSLFGISEIALRIPSIIFSLIAGWYVYKMGGKWAAAFFLFNPLVMYYSQEARMHMMATALLSITLYYFLLLIKENQNTKLKSKSKHVILFNVFSALAMWVFYGSGFFIGAMIVVSLFVIPMKIGIQKGILHRFRIRSGMTLLLSIGLICSIIILSPLLYLQLLNSKAGLAELTNWSGALGNVDFKNIGLIFIKFATGRLSWYPKWSYYLIAGIPTAIIWIVVAFGMRKNKVLAALFILPLIFGMIVSLAAPMMMYFRFLYLIPVMSLLLVSSQKKNIFDWISPQARTLPASAGMTQKSNLFILFSFIIFSFVYLTRPQFHREDWKSAARELSSSLPLYMIIPSSDPIAYYRNDVDVHELRTLNKYILPETIQVIPYTSNLYGVDYISLLKQKGCIRESQANFRGDVVVEKWKCLRRA